MMAKFFGTNGVRGVFGDDLTLEFLSEMTMAIGTIFARGPVLVGYDGRRSSQVICKAVCSALNYIGMDCNVAGLVPTPCLQYAVKKLGYSGGLMITASHNPPEYNGLKPIAANGVEISRDDELAVEGIYEKKEWQQGLWWGETGKEDRAVQTYLDGILSVIDSELVRSKNFKIALDVGNGVQAVCAPDLARMLGCQVSVINPEIDPDFSGRGSEPTVKNLSELSCSIQENGADLGVAFDGDGDRSMFCDERGQILTGDRSSLVLAGHILQDNCNSVIVTCINSGSGIEEMAERLDFQVIRTKVGSVEVSQKMLKTGAIAGYEENGGFMFGRHNPVRDGCMAMALMLEMLATRNVALSKELDMLPASFTAKDKIGCSAEDAARVLSILEDEFPESDTTDGIKISLDKSWIMARPSGTEPIIRIYGQAASQQELDCLMSQYTEKIRSILGK